MPREELPHDPKALEEWRNLPQNKPSRDAMPPITGGTQLTWALLALTVIVALIALLSQLGH